MSLTEEQREALSNALDYIRETKLPVSGICEYDIAVIRAMIDSSEDADYENLRCENCGKTLKEIRGSKYAGDYCLGEIRIDPGQEASWSDPPIEPSYYFWCDECKNDGKISIGDHIVGPDQMVPNGKVWQITEERKDALNVAVCEIENIRIDSDACPLEFQVFVDVLRAMLKEAEQCKWRCAHQ